MIDMNWTATNTIRSDARNQWLLLTHSQTVSLSLTLTLTPNTVGWRPVETEGQDKEWKITLECD
jgi:hypothetical protein